jgi:hypothetical protein
MGCTHTNDHMLAESLEIPIDFTMNQEKIINLEKGGIIMKTSIGNIQYGIPPETVKDSMTMGVSVPEYYIIPRKTFDWNDGINLMEFEFPVYFNFFVRQRTKTKIICDEETKNNILIIFQETLLGPKNFDDFEKEFIEDYKGIPDMKKELSYFAVNPFQPEQPLSCDLFIEFLVYDKSNTVKFSKEITLENGTKSNCEIKIIRKNYNFLIYENNKYLGSFEEDIKLNKKNFYIFKTFQINEKKPLFNPPVFGFTMLGSSHGFDAKGSTSGFILWINKKGIMIDPPPYSSTALKELGVPPNLIEKIIISHCHADHDAGAFHKIIEASRIEFLSTPTILNSFLRKYSAGSGIGVQDLKKLFHYRYCKVGHPTLIFGARFLFSYAFHSIPSLRFEVTFKNKRFFFSSDTFFNPEKLLEIKQKGIFSEERYKSLVDIDFSKYDCILHEAGIPPIHTPITSLDKLPEQTKKKIFLYHIAEKDIPENAPYQKALPGLENTVNIINNQEQDPIMSNIDLLCSVELINWVPFNRINEIIECFEEREYKAHEVIIKENTYGDKFYIIKSGVIKVYLNHQNNKFSKDLYRGDYFGESAIIGDGHRLANVETMTKCVLLEINKEDFNWVFDFNESEDPSSKLTPIQMMKNLSEIRKAKDAEFINYNKVVKRMTENQKCLINMYIKKKIVKKDEDLWVKGKNTEFCFFIQSGKFEMKAPSNKIPKNFFLTEGSLVGDFSNLVEDKITSSSVKCIESGVIYLFMKNHFKHFLKQYPGFNILIKDCFVIN